MAALVQLGQFGQLVVSLSSVIARRFWPKLVNFDGTEHTLLFSFPTRLTVSFDFPREHRQTKSKRL